MINAGLGSLSKWRLNLLPKDKQFHSFANIECAGGMNLERLLNMYLNSTVTGVDYLKVPIEVCIKLNKQAFLAHRAEVVQPDVSSLPISNKSFDLICAFETIYF